MAAAAAAARAPRAARLVRRLLVALVCRAPGAVHDGQPRRRQNARAERAAGAVRRQPGIAHLAQGAEGAAVGTGVFVDGHRMVPQEAAGMSGPGVTSFSGPSALGLRSKSKISVGSHRVAQALGMSTTPLMWPSTGAVPRMESAWAPL